jgi:hypothetical protein
MKRERCIPARGLMQRCDRHAAQPAWSDCLCIHHLLVLSSEPDQVARISKSDDLTASVDEDLVQGDHASLNPEQMRRRIAFGKHELLCFNPVEGALCQILLEVLRSRCAGCRLE